MNSIEINHEAELYPIEDLLFISQFKVVQVESRWNVLAVNLKGDKDVIAAFPEEKAARAFKEIIHWFKGIVYLQSCTARGTAHEYRFNRKLKKIMNASPDKVYLDIKKLFDDKRAFI